MISDFKDELSGALIYLKDYLRNPVHRIQALPEWSWPTLLLVQISFAILSGAMSGVVSQSLFVFLTSLLSVPLAALVIVLVCTSFLYYTILLFKNQQLPFRKLLVLTILANLPFLLFQTLSSLVPPINLVGFAFTCALLAVGLVENFKLPKKFTLKVLALLYAGFILLWALGRIEVAPSTSQWKSVTTQHSDPNL